MGQDHEQRPALALGLGPEHSQPVPSLLVGPLGVVEPEDKGSGSAAREDRAEAVHQLLGETVGVLLADVVRDRGTGGEIRCRTDGSKEVPTQGKLSEHRVECRFGDFAEGLLPESGRGTVERLLEERLVALEKV